PRRRRVQHQRGARHHRDRYRQHRALLRARPGPRDPLRRRRRPRGLYLVRHPDHQPQGGMAGLASAGRDDLAPALSAALHGRWSRQSARRAGDPSRLAPMIRMPFGDNGPFGQQGEGRRYGGGQAFCVRTCDGRHFPVTASDNQSRAASCGSLCPTSETKLVYGSSIDNAATDDGKRYSELPNAFRYRNELVSGCTCNGKDQVGLAPVKIEDDPTLRNGDIVAGENGLLVAGRSGYKRGAELNFSPASDKVRAKYGRVPV